MCQSYKAVSTILFYGFNGLNKKIAVSKQKQQSLLLIL